MDHHFEQHLTRVAARPEVLSGTRVGLEKECLRADLDGNIVHTPHPQALGSALTNPFITTDYSEALLEFITPPCEHIEDCLAFLYDVHRFVYARINQETLWATSMPCVLAGEQSIPIARYGNSNAGRMKHVYRQGLGHRYGRVMQVIAGIHFNHSLPEPFWAEFREVAGGHSDLGAFTSERYFALIRNLQRFGWLVPYLFGASPAVCKSFFADQPDALGDFEEFDASTVYLPFATSFRVSDIGYQNRKELKSGLNVSYNSLQEYVGCLDWAVRTPNPEYERIGVAVDGEYHQLSANVLQIENEYYSSVRPKQLAGPLEWPSMALKTRGVAYVELRSVDVNPFEPVGIDPHQLRFLETFMLFCLFHESPPIERSEREEIDYNLQETACRGRDPALNLSCGGQRRGLRQWAGEICDQMAGIGELLDTAKGGNAYREGMTVQCESVRDADRTPSARVLETMRRDEEGFYDFAMSCSHAHRDYFEGHRPRAKYEQLLLQASQESLQRQREMEAADDVSFDEYLRRYFAQETG